MSGNSLLDDNRLLENRQIIIFLSSTFSDMQEERSALVKCFEKLKLTAARRNVTLSLLDLRWGVTDEEARSGKVISVCLNEIERSYPFFIGLLGNRYGYSPDPSDVSKNPDLLERYPWLNADIAAERSITEIEMLYGALRHIEHPVEAEFYIKQTSDPDDNIKQTALKETICRQKQYPVEDYSDVEELCTLVESHVNALLDRYFPVGTNTPLERERTAQRAYINSRHSHFIGREKELEYLDTFSRSTKRRLVITGESGIGKSALLANWIKRNEKNDDFNLVYHFVGNSFAGNDYLSVLRHLCDEIYDIYQIEKDLDRQEKPKEEAQRLISELAHRKPLVVVIDGINQIMVSKDEKLLLWLPAPNDKVKFIFTTLRDDQTMQAFERRGYEIHTLEALTDSQRKLFAIKYLERVGKHLDRVSMQRIIDDPESHNTLVLRTLLDELICFGSYEHLNDRIDYYLSANGKPDFFDRVLRRMEDDYNNGQELVCHVLRLISLSEQGMSEEEILAITGFRQIDWHLFYCAFFNHLVVKGGLITFSHQYIANAVANRYATDNAETSARYRQEIVKYFAALSPNDEIQRQRCFFELAHQYNHLADWPNLYNILLSFEAFYYYHHTKEVLFAKYWRKLISVDNKKYVLSDYLNNPLQIEKPTLSDYWNQIGLFISFYFADYEKASEYLLKALTIREESYGPENPHVVTMYNNIGLVYHHQGEYFKALDYYQKALAVREKSLGRDHPDTATIYNNIGGVYKDLGEYEKALKYHLMALPISEKFLGKEHPDIGTINNNIGLVYSKIGDHKKALEYFFKDVTIQEIVHGQNHPDTATSYHNIGSEYDSLGQYTDALKYHNKALAIKKQAFGEDHTEVAIIYHSIGHVFFHQGSYGKAMDYESKALEIMKKVVGEEHPFTAFLYDSVGILFKKQHDIIKAIDFYQKALEIRKRTLGMEHPDTASSYDSLGNAYAEQSNYGKAMECFQLALEIRKKSLSEEHPDTVSSYNNIGALYYELGDYDKALKYLIKVSEIFEKVFGKEHPSTATSYNNIGSVYDEKGNFDKALEYSKKALAISEKVLGEKHPDTATTYNNIGELYRKHGDYANALRFHFKALEVFKTVYGIEHPHTASSFANIGLVYSELGDYAKAMELQMKALAIKEKALGSEHPNTAISYFHIGEIYNCIGSYNNSLVYLNKAGLVFEKVLGSKHPYTAAVLSMIIDVKKKMK